MKDYGQARAAAQKTANELGMDVGLEHNPLFKEYRSFLLPRKENRRGFELRCEVVSPENAAKTMPGHGFR
jgi:hypothetical protein